jgi:mono/diheme cytochrome c family protein
MSLPLIDCAAHLLACRLLMVCSQEERLMRTYLMPLLAGFIVATAARADADKATERTWRSKCAMCHGATGKGNPEMKTQDLTAPDFQKGTTDAQIKDAIENGVKKNGGEMEPFKDSLSAAQVDSLVAYVRSLK